MELIFAVIAALILFASSEASASGTEAASFLDIPVGGRPAAVGGAYSTLAGDAYAPVWNPAGLGLLNAAQLSAMHLDFTAAAAYEFASFVLPLAGGSGVGISGQYFHPHALTGRNASGFETGDFSSHYGAYSAAVGHAFTQELSAGAAAKFIDASLGDSAARAAAADIGALYRIRPDIAVAAVISNLGTRMKFIDESDPLPQSFRAGLLYNPSERWNFVGDGIYDRFHAISGRFGIEWTPVQYFSMRAGYMTDTARHLSGAAGLTTGIGFKLFGQRFDYAWLPLGSLGQTQYFSIVVSFGP